MKTFVILYKEKIEDEFFKSFVQEDSKGEVETLLLFKESYPDAVFGVMYNKDIQPKYKTHEKTTE